MEDAGVRVGLEAGEIESQDLGLNPRPSILLLYQEDWGLKLRLTRKASKLFGDVNTLCQRLNETWPLGGKWEATKGRYGWWVCLTTDRIIDPLDLPIVTQFILRCAVE